MEVDMGEEPIEDPRLTFRERVAGLILASMLFRSTKRQIDAHVPVAVSSTKLSQHLAAMALQFAHDGQVDIAAVEALRSAAGRRRKELRRAAAGVRIGSEVNENRIHFRANQLLLAAATGQPLQTMTPQQEAVVQRIEELLQGTGADAFARLVALQPALADVARTIEQATETVMRQPADERRLAVDQLYDRVGDLLRPLVGPEAEVGDPLLRTRAAYEFAAGYLNPGLMIKRHQGVDYCRESLIRPQ